MPADVADRVIQVMAKTQHLPPESITIDQTFAELKFDSLDGMNILFAIVVCWNLGALIIGSA